MRGLAVLVALALLLPATAHAQTAASEYEVKAAYLYNFGRFVTWPADSAEGEAFSICVLGRDPFGRVLETTLAGQSIRGRKVVATRVAAAQDALQCRIVYVSTSEESKLGAIVDALAKSGALTVSDIPQFARRGGMIQFVADQGRVRFEVNLPSAEQAGLSVSSDLLRVARTVLRTPAGGD